MEMAPTLSLGRGPPPVFPPDFLPPPPLPSCGTDIVTVNSTGQIVTPRCSKSVGQYSKLLKAKMTDIPASGQPYELETKLNAD